MTFFVLVSWSTTALSTNKFCKAGIRKQTRSSISFDTVCIQRGKCQLKRKITGWRLFGIRLCCFIWEQQETRQKAHTCLRSLDLGNMTMNTFWSQKGVVAFPPSTAQLPFFCESFKLMTHSSTILMTKRYIECKTIGAGTRFDTLQKIIMLRRRIRMGMISQLQKQKRQQQQQQHQQSRMAYMDRWSRRRQLGQQDKDSKEKGMELRPW